MVKRLRYSAIGLDISSSSIKLLQLEEHKGVLSPYDAASIELNNTQDEDELSGRLGELLAGIKLKGKRAIVTLPAQIIMTTPIKFMLKEDEPTDHAILREAGNYLPFSVESSVIDYLILPSTDQRSQSQKSALLIAAKREDILRYIGLFKQLGLEAVAIEPRYCSLFRTIQWIQEKPLKDQFIFYVGENYTTIMILVDERILIVREIHWGVKAVKTKMEKTLGLSREKAEKVLQQYGVEVGLDDQNHKKIGPLDVKELGQVIHEVINPILEELCQEIQRLIAYSASIVQQRAIDQALLLGKGTKIKSLAHFIQQRTGIRSQSWDDSARTNLFMEKQPFFEVALGLALRDQKCLV